MINKTIYRQAIKDILLKYMLEGKLKPNERLSLPQLAKELDTSVTPVREALTQLTETGIVIYRANRGFFVADIDEQEALELYQLIILLEVEALRNSVYTPEQLELLAKLNHQFHRASTTVDRVKYDTLFHQKLIENYSNQSAKKIIEDIRSRISIYELKFMDAEPASTSSAMHEQIINFLVQGDTESAQTELRRNWEIGLPYLGGQA